MKKIMLYINQLGFGGAERVISNLATDLKGCGYDVILVTSTKLEQEYTLGKDVRRINLNNLERSDIKVKRNFLGIKKLRRLCIIEKPDILISFMIEENMRSLLATIGLPIKTIISVRNDPDFECKGIIGKCIGKYLYRLANGVVFQTKDAKAWFSNSIQKKSRIIFNAVNEKFYDIKRYPIDFNIVNCGRLEYQKNQKLLINAFKRLLVDFPNASLNIYGAGTLKNDLKNQIDNLGLNDKVLLRGLSLDMPKVLSEADVFVLSSDFEGMPNALMEAMAAGVPCISTDCPCGGPKTLFGKSLLNWLVPINDEDALYLKMKEIISSNDQKNKVGILMRSRAVEFNPTKILKEWIDYIEFISKS